MALDWNDLKVFLALERGGSARAAATRLGTSHSTVLRRLQTLEDALGTKVFDRTPDGLILTGPGARLLVKAQQIEAEVFEVERDVLGADIRMQGPIRLTLPPPVAKYLLLPHLARFRKDYPEIELEVIATYGYSDLGRRDADIAIRFSGAPDDHLVGRQLPQFRDAVFASHAYVDANCRMEANLNAAWIGWPEVARFADRIAPTAFASHPVAWRLPGLELQAEAARQGLGMALLPCIMGDKDPSLRRVPGTGTYDTLPAWLLTHPDLRRMERVRVFARMIAQSASADSDFVSGMRPWTAD
jgi:DNA-binding transcriptional LysR family regulator